MENKKVGLNNNTKKANMHKYALIFTVVSIVFGGLIGFVLEAIKVNTSLGNVFGVIVGAYFAGCIFAKDTGVDVSEEQRKSFVWYGLIYSTIAWFNMLAILGFLPLIGTLLSSAKLVLIALTITFVVYFIYYWIMKILFGKGVSSSLDKNLQSEDQLKG